MVFEHDYKKFPELTRRQLDEFGFSSPHVQITEDFRAKVIRVHDGDTVTLRTNFRDFDFPLRLLDIDTKELGKGGEAAQSWLENRILRKNVEILIDPEQRVEKWGRLLGRVFHGGLNVGEEELNRGLATLFEARNEGKIINPLEVKPWD